MCEKDYISIIGIRCVHSRNAFWTEADDTTEANSSSSDTKAYAVGAWFNDGRVVFVSPNKKASSPTRYGTKAFVIRLDQTRTDKNAPQPDPLGAECTPLAGGEEKYVRIDLYKDEVRNTDLWKVEDIGECE